jgi:hypothetical protein
MGHAVSIQHGTVVAMLGFRQCSCQSL